MPVTYTAKRALRSSKRKAAVNNVIISQLEVAVRQAKKIGTKDIIQRAMSFADRAAKNNIIHKNKASRIKSTLSKIGKKETSKPAHKIASKVKKTSKKK